MKKSTNDSPSKSPTEPAKEPSYQPPVIWEMITMEGGIALLILYPLVVLFFLKMAFSQFT
jgi:hypothetical protein